MKHCCSLKKAGMTLVEVTVASALMVLALGGLLATLMMSKKYATLADNQLDALQIARGHVEKLMGYSYDSILLTNGLHILPSQTNHNSVYSSSYVITSSGYPEAKDLEVKVSWRNPIKTNVFCVVLRSTISYGLHP